MSVGAEAGTAAGAVTTDVGVLGSKILLVVITAERVTDAVVRLVPGVLGDDQSALNDSFSDGLLDYSHYTRPENYKGWQVPPILLSGNHQAIAGWRHQQAVEATEKKRPDLLVRVNTLT